MPASIWPGEGFLLVSGLRSGGIVLDLGQIRWLGDVEFRLATPGAPDDLHLQPDGGEDILNRWVQMKPLVPVQLHGSAAPQAGLVRADGLPGPLQPGALFLQPSLILF